MISPGAGEDSSSSRSGYLLVCHRATEISLAGNNLDLKTYNTRIIEILVCGLKNIRRSQRILMVP